MVVPLMSMLAGGCGWSNIDNFIETSARVGCRKMKKCDEDEWKAAGFDSVKDCVDERLDTPLQGPNGEMVSMRDFWADNCPDFDKESARKCLQGMRKVKRTCDDEAASSEQEEACRNVCGDIGLGMLFADPTNRDLFIELLADYEGDWDADDEADDVDEFFELDEPVD